MWPRIVADPSTLGRHVCHVCKRSVCGGDEPQPVAHLSHKLQCARQSLKIMVSYGNKYPRHNARPHVVEQSGQCARALRIWNLFLAVGIGELFFYSYVVIYFLFVCHVKKSYFLSNNPKSDRKFNVSYIPNKKNIFATCINLSILKVNEPNLTYLNLFL